MYNVCYVGDKVLSIDNQWIEFLIVFNNVLN